MERKNSKRVIVFLLTLCLLLAATGCKSEEQIQQQQVAEKAETPIYVDLRSTITVNGTGKATQTPDTATVYFSINNQGEEAEAVQQENAQAAQAVIDAILALGPYLETTVKDAQAELKKARRTYADEWKDVKFVRPHRKAQAEKHNAKLKKKL